jgi:metal-sulfur cluster biosynthetic enzyme
VILDVEPRRRSKKKKPLGWREVQVYMGTSKFDCGGGADDIEDALGSGEAEQDSIVSRSAVDQAVLQALADVSKATHGKGVGLLRRVGWVIPSEVSTASPTNLVMFSDQEYEDNCMENHDEIKRDRLDADEIFEIVRNIQDPEHPLTLEQLGVVTCEQIEVRDEMDGDDDGGGDESFVHVRFTPTIPACSMATLIGLAIKVKLQRSLPSRFKVSVRVERGTHQSEQSINKQLSDKERVCAALENPHLFKVVNRCIHNGMTGNMD